MKIVFLIPEPPAGAAGEQIRRLSERHDVVVGVTGARPAGEARLGKAPVVPADDVTAVDADVAVALHWRATVRLFDCRARRHAFWVDSLGYEQAGRVQSENLISTLAYDLPVDFIATAPWLAQALAARRPGARILLARNGVVASESSGEAALFLAEPQVDELLSAAAAGIVPVVVVCGAQQDVVEHGVSGLVVQPEDERGAHRDLERLRADPGLCESLAQGARASAAAWPSPEGAARELEAALKTIVSKAPPADSAWPARLMGDAVAVSVAHNLELAALRRQLDDLLVRRSPVRRAARRLKRGRRLAPVRLALRRFVPGRIKRLG